MFDNIDVKKSKIPSQKKVGVLIKKNKGGRPPKPNMRRAEFKINAVLLAKLDKLAKERYDTKSSIVNQALASFFSSPGPIHK